MKYIMLETAEGQKLPILFPETLTHCFMAGAMQLVLDTLDPKKDLRPKQLDAMWQRPDAARVTSAGFVAVGNDVTVYGESESLGGVKANPIDAGRIMLGDSLAFMPDAFVSTTLAHLTTPIDEQSPGG